MEQIRSAVKDWLIEEKLVVSSESEGNLVNKIIDVIRVELGK